MQLLEKATGKYWMKKQHASKTLINYRKTNFFFISVSHTTSMSKSIQEKMRTRVLKPISLHNVFGIHQPLETKPFRRQENNGAMNQKQLVKAARVRAVSTHCLIADIVYGRIKGNTDHP